MFLSPFMNSNWNKDVINLKIPLSIQRCQKQHWVSDIIKKITLISARSLRYINVYLWYLQYLYQQMYLLFYLTSCKFFLSNLYTKQPLSDPCHILLLRFFTKILPYVFVFARLPVIRKQKLGCNLMFHETILKNVVENKNIAYQHQFFVVPCCTCELYTAKVDCPYGNRIFSLATDFRISGFM